MKSKKSFLLGSSALVFVAACSSSSEGTSSASSAQAILDTDVEVGLKTNLSKKIDTCHTIGASSEEAGGVLNLCFLANLDGKGWRISSDAQTACAALSTDGTIEDEKARASHLFKNDNGVEHQVVSADGSRC